MIVSGIIIARRKMFRWHANIMLVAVMVNGLMLISHMGPTVVSVFREGISKPNVVTLLGMAHGSVGALAEFSGIWLAGMWAYVWSETKYCTMRRRWMWRIAVLWIVALGLGLAYYPLHLIWG